MTNQFIDGVAVNGFAIDTNAIATITNGDESVLNVSAKQERGIEPKLYFKFLKKKMGFLEKRRLTTQIKKIEKAFDETVVNGQELLSERLMEKIVGYSKEAVLYSQGIRYFIDFEDAEKFKNEIKGGRIEATIWEKYTRVIPKKVIKKKEKYNNYFDGFVIYHYLNKKMEKNEQESMTVEEKERARDPILFGVIKETDKLYFIEDWEDEYCDLTFDKMIDHLGKDDDDYKLMQRISLGN